MGAEEGKGPKRRTVSLSRLRCHDRVALPLVDSRGHILTAVRSRSGEGDGGAEREGGDGEPDESLWSCVAKVHDLRGASVTKLILSRDDDAEVGQVRGKLK